MRVTISSDYRYCQMPDGSVWTDGPCHFGFWTRYLAAFERVNVVARVSFVNDLTDSWRRADGDGVQFSPLPYYLGPLQYLLRSRQVTQAARQAVLPDDALILNVPGQIASCLATALSPGRPYAVQVLGDPYDVFAPGVIRHPLRPFLRWWCSRRLRVQARHAAAALYVTQDALQTRYPCPGHRVGVSDVDLPPEAFVTEPRPPQCVGDPLRIVSVGTMTQLYKGFDVLIDAVGQLVSTGLDVQLTLVGDGKHRPELEQQVRRLQLSDRVTFRGQLATGARVRAELDAHQLFVLPSRTEGLPRALVEAMARGLPCLASRVGGIPELLHPDDLVPPGDAAALANAIRRVANNPALQATMSQRHLERAADFQADKLDQRRTAFYRQLFDQTQEWLARHTTTSPMLIANEAASRSVEEART